MFADGYYGAVLYHVVWIGVFDDEVEEQEDEECAVGLSYSSLGLVVCGWVL